MVTAAAVTNATGITHSLIGNLTVDSPYSGTTPEQRRWNKPIATQLGNISHLDNWSLLTMFVMDNHNPTPTHRTTCTTHTAAARNCRMIRIGKYEYTQEAGKLARQLASSYEKSTDIK